MTINVHYTFPIVVFKLQKSCVFLNGGLSHGYVSINHVQNEDKPSNQATQGKYNTDICSHKQQHMSQTYQIL